MRNLRQSESIWETSFFLILRGGFFFQTKVNKKPHQPIQVEETEETAEAQDDDGWEVAGRGKHKAHHIPVQETPTVTEALQGLSVEDTNVPIAEADEAKDSSAVEESEDAPEEEDNVVDDEDDEDAGEWITPENVVQVKAAELGHKAEGKNKKFQVMQAACITADFAMQVRTWYRPYLFHALRNIS